MKLIEKLRVYFWGFKTLQNEIKISESDKFENDRIAGELMRNTHSIEKGLSIAKPRLGYGHKIQLAMLERIEKLQKCSNSAYYNEVIGMAVDSLNSYIKYHDEKSFTDDVIEQIRQFVKNYEYDNSCMLGGSVLINKQDMIFDIKEIERFFYARHSIRDYDDSDVSDEVIQKALRLAQRAPSACNRQGVRAYVLSKKLTRDMAQTLEGIGGFADSVNRFILVTGKLSSYRSNENRQFIVSSSIYAAYLSLTLHLYGVGACIVQRPLTLNTEWECLRKNLKIDEDEHLVLMLAIGNLKDQVKVPLSHRVDADSIFKFLN